MACYLRAVFLNIEVIGLLNLSWTSNLERVMFVVIKLSKKNTCRPIVDMEWALSKSIVRWWHDCTFHSHDRHAWVSLCTDVITDANWRTLFVCQQVGAARWTHQAREFYTLGMCFQQTVWMIDFVCPLWPHINFRVRNLCFNDRLLLAVDELSSAKGQSTHERCPHLVRVVEQ